MTRMTHPAPREQEREVLGWADFDRAVWDLAERVAADGVADTGLTLASVYDFCAGKVGTVRTATSYAKPRSVVRPDYVWHDTDRWITFPWSDRPPVTGQGVRDG